MKAVQYRKISTDSKDAEIVDIPQPVSEPGVAVVQVKSASVNPIDWKVMAGGAQLFGWAMPLPFTMGYDFSGVISKMDAADENSDGGFKVGDAVYASNWGDARHDSGRDDMVGGAFAEYVKIPLSKLSKKPQDVSFDDAAAVALAGTTAYQVLFDNLKVSSGDKVLIFGGSTAVGALAIQMAKNVGAWVATTCSPRTKDYVESIGAADLIVDYTKVKWDELDELRGVVDVVLDCAGEDEAETRASKVFKDKSKGRFASLIPPVNTFMYSNSSSVQDRLMDMLSSKKLKLVVEKKFPLTEDGINAMLEKSMSGKSMGKDILVVSE